VPEEARIMRLAGSLFTFVVVCLLTASVVYGTEYVPEYDLNQDGIIDSNDLYILQFHWHAMRPTETPTLVPSETPTATETPEIPDTPTLTETPVAVDTPTATETQAVVDTPTATETQAAVDTPTVTETLVPLDTPTATETQVAADTPTATETLVPLDTPTATETQSAADTPTATETPGVVDTPTATETPGVVDTPTATETSVAVDTPTATGTPAVVETPTATETAGVPATPTETPPATSTAEPTVTPSPTLGPNEIVIEIPDLPPGAKRLIMVRVPAGGFIMGSTDDALWSFCYPCEQPVHAVDIGYDFYIGKYETTQAQWQAVMGTNPAEGPGVGHDYPVYSVSWSDSQAFLAALNALIPQTLRLPSEAEWEYACRADTTTRFSFGDSSCTATGCDTCELDDYAWWCSNNGAFNTPEYGSKIAGGKLPNNWGIHDMHGNVWEWCQDWWHADYTGAPADGSAWIAGGGRYRVIRSGDWGASASESRSARRSAIEPTGANTRTGFRVAWTP
jgi:formylglycine-generating enzyme required for sulfatase activity